ncbi:nitroreductase [Spirochaetia bacterium]|nr:nitroreductase [Spirochaetia bacterium]
MNVVEAISGRRSIRKFLAKDIDKGIIEKILEAGILAPSAKNRQPWKFVVITNENKREMIQIIKSGIDGNEFFKKNPEVKPYAEYTVKTMEKAPVTLFVLNTENNFLLNQTAGEKLFELTNVQSIGASIENMLLAALEYGVGSLWICDIYFAYDELCKWLNTDKQIIAAISFGYPDESPSPRPRKGMGELVEWR